MSLIRTMSAAALVMLIAPAALANAHNLRGPAPAKGDAIRVESLMKIADGNVDISAGGFALAGKMSMSNDSVIESLVLEADSDRVTKLRKFVIRETSEQTMEIMGQNDTTTTDNPLAGQTAVGTFADGRWSFELENGDATAEQQSALRALARNELNVEASRSMYPDRAVAIGETWQVQPEAVEAMFGGQGANGTVTITLDKVEEVDGEKFAHMTATFDVKLEVSETNMQKATMSVKASGPIVRSLKTYLDTKVDLSGTMEMEMVQGEDMVMTMTGPLTMQVKESRPNL